MILHSHSAPRVNLRQKKLRYNWFHIALFLLSFWWHSSEKNFNRWWCSKLTCTYKLCTDTHLYLFHSEYQFTELRIPLTNGCPNHVSVRHINSSWIKFSLTVIWIAVKRADCYRHYQAFQSCWPSWKRSLSNVKNNENITYRFIAYWMQRSILFCCTETNNILRAVLSNEDAVLSMRTFTWSWWLPVSLCRSAIGIDVEPYGLHAWHNLRRARLPALTFEADICTRWKGILVQWFSKPFFHLFLRISTIDIVILIHVINLSHQIVEFSEDHDHRYCKMLNWELEFKWWSDGKKPFPALAVSKKVLSSCNRGRALFRTKQNLSPQNRQSVASMYGEITKPTKLHAADRLCRSPLLSSP